AHPPGGDAGRGRRQGQGRPLPQDPGGPRFRHRDRSGRRPRGARLGDGQPVDHDPRRPESRAPASQMKATKCPGHFVALMLLGGTVGPDYQRPATPAPATWKEAGPWKEAAPRDAIAKGAWWELFGDPMLNELQKRADANPDLRAAVARVGQARAIARISE